MQAANCSNYVGSWRHPASEPNFLTAGFYQNIARTLERGKFHFAFIDDRLAMPGRYGDAVDEALRHGVRVVKLDLTPVEMAMTMAMTMTMMMMTMMNMVSLHAIVNVGLLTNYLHIF